MDDKKFYEEKRKSPRARIPGLRVSFKLLDPRTWSSYHERTLSEVDNISLGGLSLTSTSELIVKAPVGLDLKINHESETIRTFGRVAWIKKNTEQQNYALGISFSWWKREEDKKTVFQLIQQNEVSKKHI